MRPLIYRLNRCTIKRIEIVQKVQEEPQSHSLPMTPRGRANKQTKIDRSHKPTQSKAASSLFPNTVITMLDRLH